MCNDLSFHLPTQHLQDFSWLKTLSLKYSNIKANFKKSLGTKVSPWRNLAGKIPLSNPLPRSKSCHSHIHDGDEIILLQKVNNSLII